MRRINNTFADIQNDSAVYSDLFTILLSANDSGSVYQCRVVISRFQITNSDRITLNFPSK